MFLFVAYNYIVNADHLWPDRFGQYICKQRLYYTISCQIFQNKRGRHTTVFLGIWCANFCDNVSFCVSQLFEMQSQSSSPWKNTYV